MDGLSIGELARRTGVEPGTLRAWERRYGLLRPDRTPGGHRRYGEVDVARVLHARRLVDQGIPISTAAQRLTTRDGGDTSPPTPGTARHVTRAWAAVDRLDATALDRCLRDAHRSLGLSGTIDQVAVPVMRRLGDEWRLSPRNIAREHTASAVVRSFLLQTIRDLPEEGPRCVAACPDGENHDLGAIMAATVMAGAGWHPLILGASTPWTSIEAIVAEVRPVVLFVGVAMQRRRQPLPRGWRPPSSTTVVMGGAGIAADHSERFPFAHVYRGSFAELAGSVADVLDAAPTRAV